MVEPYTRLWFPDKVKNINVKVFNLMSRVNEARVLLKHESCECKCRLNENVCTSRQKWNHNKCRCEYKKSINWSSCEKGYMWNLCTCDCACDKTC